MKPLRIGSRPSRLAIIQAEMVRDAIASTIPDLDIEIVPIRTSGDKILTPSLADVGGKGLFIKELEQALAERRIDVAVHSMKDLPAVLAPQFRIVATPQRENPRDALITPNGAHLKSLPKGAKLGTSSPRRKFEALGINPGLEVVPLRGNVDTRVGKLQSGEMDAIIVAMAGLKRLGKLQDLKYEELNERDFVPSAAQAALAIETLSDGKICGSDETDRAVASLNHWKTECETTAERAFLASIHASCVTPVGVKATLTNDRLSIRAILFSTDGTRSLEEEIFDHAAVDAARLGENLGAKMIARGARDLLDET
ncbi:MAG TPA: hydroxymethylbilane synthase [Candidatus Binataceae bacterium]|nr:hydroxymethylbilane synthase [Candidatus Binataceae bacterium]